MKISLTLLTIMAILIPAVSSGFGGRSYQDGLFFGVDLDRNERIDLDEAKNAYNLAEDEIFARFDKNGNGSINQFEFYEFIQQAPWTDRFVHPRDKG
ncbi:MAG: hypothetical protein ACR2P5_08570 [Gammaproteobacteria bacterium]